MKIEISEDIGKKYKGVKIEIAMGILKGIDNRIDNNSEEFMSFVSQECSKIRLKYLDDTAVNKDKRVKAYRSFYWKIGLDPTKMRPANEALLRRIIIGEGLPQINVVVDAYNVASVRTVIPMCAYDLKLISGETLYMRLAKKGEKFFGIGMDTPLLLTGKEIVVCDAEGSISLYPYRDCERTKVTKETKDILLTVDGVPGIIGIELLWALKVCVKYITRHVDGKAEVVL